MNVSENYSSIIKNYQNDKVHKESPNSESASNEEKNYAVLFHQMMVEMSEKYRNGETEQKIKIGTNEFTVKEWKDLLVSFDKAQQQIKEEIDEEQRVRQEKKQAEAIRQKLKNISPDEIRALVGEQYV